VSRTPGRKKPAAKGAKSAKRGAKATKPAAKATKPGAKGARAKLARPAAKPARSPAARAPATVGATGAARERPVEPAARRAPGGGHVVFLRAANVGGKNVFHPAELAAALRHLDVVNIGAVGTFVVRSTAPEEEIRTEILKRLPFRPELSVRPAREIAALVDSRPFEGVAFSKDLRGWVAALAAPPAVRPALPLHDPPGAAWWVRFDRLDGAFALGLWQRRPGNMIYPNQLVEKVLGVPATTRFWETVEKIAKLL
jgi:uncharacterized protein (DUF1697 family)